ncbi:Hypp565 [Branchiostoma lanceolatum]|uniref:Hypp565 protein n=1 Tax=Branchiostoma lanceolatum TaxID=7740 RepID=A0A8J9W137_BRALA|nr:Hypp565 [Branchiostoma lanceolatum]
MAAELVGNELDRLSVAVAGLTEVRWPGSGSHVANDFNFLWSGRDDGQHRQGVALALAPSASRALVHWKPVNNRLLLARLRHTHGRVSVIVAYAPTNMAPDEEKDEFYIQMSALMDDISRHDIIWVLGDFNATTGPDRDGFERALGPHGTGSCNNNGSRLLEFCTNHHLRTERSFFPHKRIHSMTWISNDGYTRKELDHILTNRRWHTTTDCRVYRSAELGNTDHRLLAMTVCLRLQRDPTSKVQRKVDISRLRSPEVAAHFQLDLHNRFAALSTDEDNSEEIWSDFKKGITTAATKVLGHKRRKKKKDFLSEETLHVVEARRTARLEGNHSDHRRLNAQRNKLLRKDKQTWLDDLADEAEASARRGDQGSLYRTLKTLSGKSTPPTAPVKALDGSIPDTPEKQVARWREHFQSLLNRPPPTPSPQLDEQAASATEDDSVPTGPPVLDEVAKAIQKLKAGRAAGADGIAPELLLQGGPAVAHQLQHLFTAIWNSEAIPADWLLGVILPFWKKGPKDLCSNYRGITLLSVPGKVFANVLLARLRPLLLRKQRREQSGFTPGRSTVDRILALRLLAERRREYRKPLYAAYVDLKQAFDSVDRPALWKILKIIGVPAKLIKLLSLLYSDTSSCVRVNGKMSDSFTINSGVRQGCVLAPTVFNTAIDYVMGRTVAQCACGASFGDITITDLDYADDVAILAELLDVLQLALEVMDRETQPLGLMVSWEKTKVQSLSDYEAPPAALVINTHRVEPVDRFCYLGGTITSDCKCDVDINLRIGRASSAMANLDRVWCSRRISPQTKIRLYNSLVLPILTYGGETWTLTAAQECRLDAFDTKCQRRILGIRWYDHISNDILRERSNQPPLSGKLRSARLRLLGHLIRAEPPLEPASLLKEPPPPTHLGSAQREAQTDLDRPSQQRPAGSRPHHRHCLGDSAEQDGLEKGLPRRHAPLGSKRT